MNEKMLIEQLNHDVDHLLDGHTLSNTARLGDEYHQLVETAQLLAHHDMSSTSRVRKTLRHALLLRISDRRKEWSPNEKGDYWMKTRSKRLAYMGVLAIILLAAALPPVQALAQEILKHVGPYIVISQDLPLEPPPAGFTPTPIQGISNNQSSQVAEPSQYPGTGSGYASNTHTPIPPDPNVQAINPEEALTRFNFKVLMPSYIPEGFALINAPDFVFAAADYINSSMVYTTANEGYLSISQSTFDQQDKYPFYVGEAGVTQIKVRGKEAIFVKDAMLMTVLDANGQNITLPLNYLMWEEDGLFFMLQGHKLTQVEMVKVAEALK